jgi:regulatory protein YycI of two-component signal transduction system YycFG
MGMDNNQKKRAPFIILTCLAVVLAIIFFVVGRELNRKKANLPYEANAEERMKEEDNSVTNDIKEPDLCEDLGICGGKG